MCFLVGFEVVKSRADSLSRPWLQHHLGSPLPPPRQQQSSPSIDSGLLSLEISELLKMQSQTEAAHAAEPGTVAIESWFIQPGRMYISGVLDLALNLLMDREMVPLTKKQSGGQCQCGWGICLSDSGAPVSL